MTMTQLQKSAKQRVLFFDQIKAVMIALVVLCHVTLTFFPEGSFMGIGFVGRSQPNWLTGFDLALVEFFNTFYMCMLFLISGYFVPRSVAKKGVSTYLRERLIRLGVPFLVGLLLINNLSFWLSGFFPGGVLRSVPLASYPFNHLVVLWFLVVLFSFDLLYCGWIRLSGHQFTVDATVPTPQLRSWLISAVVLAVIEVLMTLPSDFWSILLNSPLDGLGTQGSHVFTYAFLFFLGCKAAAHQWLERLDAHLVVRWFRLSVFLSLLMLGICVAVAVTGNFKQQLPGISVLFDFMNTFIGWGVMGYLLLWFQRYEQACGQWLATAGVDSFLVYIIHPLIIVLVIGSINFFAWPNLLSWIVGGAASVLVSFGLSHQLRRIPAISRLV